ncbi:MAG: hypothetical protein A3K19_27225 [Lentisphaerae bacterium RIFOXYB12_FULL_65_16]|nr:MAG: hypothetical protein A3K18_16050 [Lentisphaerae bacterium RIFOXYA12_64_32]OGV86382.1 MAG: hypothetical protein A3K19_27225 [Lentisphaerae bacterium RIFOXYB12_FULL_65_16]
MLTGRFCWTGWLAGGALFTAVLGAKAAGEPQTLMLVDNGKPVATLVLAEKPSHIAAFAAQELQLHVRRITGVDLPVATDAQPVTGTRILVGESAVTRELGLKSADFASQEYLVGFRPNALVLMGNDKPEPPPSNVAVRGTPQPVDGRFGRALRFDGKTALRVTAPGFRDDAGTLECWVRLPKDTPAPPGAGTLLRLDGANPWTYHIVEAGNGARKIKYVTYDGKNGTAVVSGDLAPGWHHIAATHSVADKKLELFIDGKSQGTAAFNLSTCKNATLHIGGIGTDAPDKPVGNAFTGDLDEVRISETVLTVTPEGLAAAPDVAPGTALLLRLDEESGTPVDVSGRLRSVALPGAYDAQGTCYAVYDFLEKFCGARWFAPGEVGLVCPSAPTLKVTGQDVRRAPRFIFRQGTYLPVYGILKALWNNPSGYDVQLYARRMRLGGQPYAANHSFYGFYDRFYEKNLKNESLFESEHKDWFAQGYSGQPPQMCFTNPGFIGQVVQDARDFYDGKGAKAGAQANGDFFALVPMDNSSWCKCPACQAEMDETERENKHFSNGIASDYVFGFANKVAKEIRQSHPSKYLATLSYSSYAYYPKTTRLESNIAVQLCLHVRNWWAPAMEENDMAFYNSWVGKEKDRPIYLWLYYCFPEEIAMNGGWRCFPGFFAHTIDRQFKMFARDGIRGAFLNNMGDYLDTYVTFRFLDDPDLNIDQIIDEFHRLYYGAAAEPMKKLYLRIEEIYTNPANYPEDIQKGLRHTHQTEELAWVSLGTAERMAELGQYMAEATRLAQTDIEKQRVALFEKGVWEYMLEGRGKRAERERLQPEVEKLKAQGPATASVPKLPDAAAAGDPAKVDWAKAALLGNWRQLEGYPAKRTPEARVAHDGQFLYVRLSEPVETAKLHNDDGIWAGDDWEVFFARQRARPYRQVGVNPKGAFHDIGCGDGEPMPPSGVKVVSDTSKPDAWTVCLVFPLDTLLPGGVKPGSVFYGNFFRATGEKPRELTAWTPNFSASFHIPARLGELKLE